jgi:hypothetical protein
MRSFRGAPPAPAGGKQAVPHFAVREEHPLYNQGALVISKRAFRAAGISGKLQGHLLFFR